MIIHKNKILQTLCYIYPFPRIMTMLLFGLCFAQGSLAPRGAGSPAHARAVISQAGPAQVPRAPREKGGNEPAAACGGSPATVKFVAN